jgi:hypothetical protein
MQRFSEIGGIMRKIFVWAAVTASLCSLAISVTPAFGHEFDSETASVITTKSNTAQIFWFGSNWVECLTVEMEATPALGLSSRLKIKLKEYTGCVYNYSLKSHLVTVISPNCVVELANAGLVEVSKNEFDGGLAKPECKFEIKTSACLILINKPTTTLPEFEWENTNTTSGHLESLLTFRLEKLEYTITGSPECGSSGTAGEYDGSIPIDDMIVK